jgi:hypothetical protein
MFRLKKFIENREGASEIVGTALFLIILFFFFTNVFLWHDQVTREMDQVVSDKMNSAITVEFVSNATDEWVVVTNVGGLDVALSRVWILTEDVHYFARLDTKSVHIPAGHSLNITFSDVPATGAYNSVRFVVEDASNIEVNYPPSSGDAIRVFTRLANSASCSWP